MYKWLTALINIYSKRWRSQEFQFLDSRLTVKIESVYNLGPKMIATWNFCEFSFMLKSTAIKALKGYKIQKPT